MKRIKYAIGNQSFRDMRERGVLYVDKTGFIKGLLQNKFYFLGRPRRFGKSLLLSMLEEFFLGRKDLFRELIVWHDFPGEWKEHPVFHFDFNGVDYSDSDSDSLGKLLNAYLSRWESKYDIRPTSDIPGLRFMDIVLKAVELTSAKAVILIDEYDKPLTDSLDNVKLQKEYHNTLRGFYSMFKTLDPYLEFVMFTGVTRFGKLNLFSGLNNLRDISLVSEFSAICGITEEELYTYYNLGAEELAKQYGLTVAETYARLKHRYDGYHFSEYAPDIYNPFSINCVMADMKFGDYWFASGTPKILIDLLVNHPIDIEKLNDTWATADQLTEIIYDASDTTALFYQTGYLTIKDYMPSLRIYRLGFPNLEVEECFLKSLLKRMFPTDVNPSLEIANLVTALRDGKAEKFVIGLKAFFAGIPYNLRRNQNYESWWQSIMYVLLRLLGEDVMVERHTSQGSIDITISTLRYVYVVEMKVSPERKTKIADEKAIAKTLKAAEQQIEQLNYLTSYAADNRCLYAMALVFSPRLGTIAAHSIKYKL